MSMYVGVNQMISGPSQLTYLAAPMWNAYEYISMMSQAFKAADQNRDFLSQNGSWMNRTASLASWSRVDTYA